MTTRSRSSAPPTEATQPEVVEPPQRASPIRDTTKQVTAEDVATVRAIVKKLWRSYRVVGFLAHYQDDVVQEVLVALLLAPDAGSTNLEGWIYRVASRTVGAMRTVESQHEALPIQLDVQLGRHVPSWEDVGGHDEGPKTATPRDIRRAMTEANGSVPTAASALGITEQYLRRLFKKYELTDIPRAPRGRKRYRAA